MLLNICKMLGADRYVSSIGAKEYMEEDGAQELFKDEEIVIEFLEYAHPVYPQLFREFVPQLSFVDCLFNCGPNSSKIVFGEETK